MDQMSLLLSSELDRGVDLYPLLSFGEAKALRHVLHLAAQGDGEGSSAARDLLGRLDRRLEVMFPDEDILFGEDLRAASPSSWFADTEVARPRLDTLEQKLKALEEEHFA